MVTIGDALRDTIKNNYGNDGGGGTKPSEIVHIIDNRATPPYRPTTEFVAVWLPIPCRRTPVNDNYVDVTCHLMVRVSTNASDDRLKVIVDEVRRVCNKCAVKYVNHQLVIGENNISDRRVPVYMMDFTVELTSNMVKSEIAYDGVTYEGHTHDHDTLTNVTADQHHAQSHMHDGDTLQLDGINSNGGAFAFNTTGGVLFNQWIGTTGSQMTIKQTGLSGDVAELLMGGNRVAVGYDGAGSLFLTGKAGKQVKVYSDNTIALSIDVLQDATFHSHLTVNEDLTAANIITSGNVDSVDVSGFKSSYDTHVGNDDAHHSQSHVLSGSDHTASGLTIGDVLSADSATTFSWKAPASDITGSGTQWKLPVWDTTSSLSDSMLSQDSGGTLLTVSGDMTVNETIRRTASNQALVLLGGNAEATGASLIVTGDTYASPASVIVQLSAGASGGQFRIMDYDGVSSYTEAFTINSDGYIDHYGKSNSFSDNDVIAWDSGSSKFTVQTLLGTDDDAIHDNVANEITAITPKTSLVTADEFVLEDSGALFVKKAVTFGNLQSSMSLANLGTRAHSNLSDAPTSAHHVRYADSEVESVIDAEIVNGQSIDNAIDALINTHNVANNHIDHTGVYVYAGTGLTGGGHIGVSRTLNVIGGAGINVNADNIECTITQYTDALAKTACVSDVAYGAGWNAVTTIAPSKNAVYDKIQNHIGLPNVHHLESHTLVSHSDVVFTDPDADKIVFWDDGTSHFRFLAASTGLSIVGFDLVCDITQYTDAQARTAAVSDVAYQVQWNGVTTIAPSKNAVYDQLVTHYANANEHHAQSHDMNSHSDASLADPGADRIVFWDETSNQVEWLVANTGLAISGNNLNCSITQYTDALARTACVSDAAYGTGWNGVTTIAPSKNAVYDELVAHYANASEHHTKYTNANARAACIIDTVFGSGWNGDTTYGASKNALYDAINPLKQLRSHAMNLNIFNGAAFYYGNAMSAAYLPSGDDNAGITYKVPVPESWVGTTATMSIMCALEHASNTFSWAITVKAIGFAGEAWPGTSIITNDTTHDITGTGTSLHIQVETVSLSSITAGDILMVSLASDASNANNLYVMDVWID